MLLVLSAITVVVLLSMASNKLSGKKTTTRGSGYSGNYGFDLIEVDRVIAREFGVPPEGVIINQVYPDTPAANAGFERGDFLVEINGSLVSSVSIARSLLFTFDTNDPLRLAVIRGKQKLTLTLPSPGSYPQPKGPPEGSFKNYILASGIFITVFVLLYFNFTDRVITITLGAALMIIVGGLSGFYSQEAAFSSIKLNVLALLLGLNLVTIILERGGFFDYVSNRILIFSNNDVQRITIVFCLATYLFSAFVNNLTTIMVFLPVSFALIKNMPINFKKFLFCEITASNLGGASSMIGDFPNMLISSETGIMFHDFLFNMVPVTFILLVIMLFYFKNGMKTEGPANVDIENIIENAKLKLNSSITNYRAVSRGIAVLVVLIIGFTLSNTIHIHPSIMALSGGFFLLLFELEPSSIIKEVCFKDIIFFCSLFVLVGGLHAAGILEKTAYLLSTTAGENLFLKLVFIIILSALCTSFLNAGPSTALFIPILSTMVFPAGSYIAWWALSIGVCIGSCATLTGATAGPIAMTLYEKFMKKEPIPAERTISFMEYSKIGFPLIGIFTLVSILYIGLLNLLI